MQFNHLVHTKEYLLRHPSVAIELAMDSTAFAKHELAQDLDILALRTNNGKSVALLLSICNSVWLDTDAARRIEVLAIADDQGYTLAHGLVTRKSGWDLSDVYQRFDVLSLADHEGNTVAHTLAKNSRVWFGTKAAQQFDVLSLKNNSGRTVAHNLAQYCPYWLTAEIAHDIRILNLSTSQGYAVAHAIAEHQPSWQKYESSKNFEILSLANERGVTVAHFLVVSQPEWFLGMAYQHKSLLHLESLELGSVAQKIMLHRQDKSELLIDLVRRGFAYKTTKSSWPSAQPKFKPDDIETFILTTSQEQDDEHNPMIKMKKLIVYFSTLRNLLDSVRDELVREKLEIGCDSARAAIIQLWTCEQENLGDVHQFDDKNCDHGMELLLQLVSQTNLAQDFVNDNKNIVDEIPMSLATY
jgi:hypothetical protein